MTELGEIPNEWEIIKLNECGYIFGGNAFKSSSFTTEYKENDYQVIRMGNVQLGKLDLEKNPVFLSENLVGEKEKKYLLKEADILISLTGTVNKTDYGNISWVDKNNKYLLNQRVGCLRNDNGEFNNRYYYYLLQSNMFRNQFFECGVGGTGNQANVSIADLNNIKVLKLPTREQEKIASILSTVDEQIDNFDALIEKNKELKKGLMQTLLTKGIGHTKFKKTEIGEIPEEWEVGTLSSIIDKNRKITYGIVQPGEYVECGKYVIRAKDYSFGWVRVEEIFKCDGLVEKSYARARVKEGDALLTIVGSVGNLAIVPSVLNEANITQQTARLSFDKNKVNNVFYYNYLKSDRAIKEINKYMKSGVQPSLNLSDVEKFKIVIPSIEEQERISLILSSVDEKVEQYENKKQKLEELKKGLMQQLLTGMIRVTV